MDEGIAKPTSQDAIGCYLVADHGARAGKLAIWRDSERLKGIRKVENAVTVGTSPRDRATSRVGSESNDRDIAKPGSPIKDKIDTTAE
jgi:hypothetical protein